MDESIYIFLRVIMSTDPTGGAGEFATGMMAALTLGIAPIVHSKDLTIRYEILVQGTIIYNMTVTKSFRDVKNIYNQSTELSKEVKEWILSTVSPFVEDIKSNESVAALQEEYNYYFAK